MATKKSGGSTGNGRDSAGRRLGLKKSGGQYVTAGNIIIRQRGTKYHPGNNVGMGKDHTIFSVINGFVSFSKTKKNRTVVNVNFNSLNPGKPVANAIGITSNDG